MILITGEVGSHDVCVMEWRPLIGQHHQMPASDWLLDDMGMVISWDLTDGKFLCSSQRIYIISENNTWETKCVKVSVIPWLFSWFIKYYYSTYLCRNTIIIKWLQYCHSESLLVLLHIMWPTKSPHETFQTTNPSLTDKSQNNKV